MAVWRLVVAAVVAVLLALALGWRSVHAVGLWPWSHPSERGACASWHLVVDGHRERRPTVLIQRLVAGEPGATADLDRHQLGPAGPPVVEALRDWFVIAARSEARPVGRGGAGAVARRSPTPVSEPTVVAALRYELAADRACP